MGPFELTCVYQGFESNFRSKIKYDRITFKHNMFSSLKIWQNFIRDFIFTSRSRVDVYVKTLLRYRVLGWLFELPLHPPTMNTNLTTTFDDCHSRLWVRDITNVLGLLGHKHPPRPFVFLHEEGPLSSKVPRGDYLLISLLVNFHTLICWLFLGYDHTNPPVTTSISKTYPSPEDVVVDPWVRLLGWDRIYYCYELLEPYFSRAVEHWGSPLRVKGGNYRQEKVLIFNVYSILTCL